MRRLLTVTMALGLVISAMNFTGIFAVFTDRASTGTNSAESGAQPRVADLQIATSVGGTCDAVSYLDNLATGVIAATDLQPGGNSGFQLLCVKNAGSAALDVTVTATDVVDTETGCTGDESDAGDASCGTPAVGDGDLSGVLIAPISTLNCATQTTILSFSPSFVDLAATGVSLGTLDPGAELCVVVAVQMATTGQLATTLADIQQAQSDKVEWRYSFDGTPA